MLTEQEQLKIKMYLLENKISITSLAKEFGMSRQWISGIINGRVDRPLTEKQLLNLIKEE